MPIRTNGKSSQYYKHFTNWSAPHTISKVYHDFDLLSSSFYTQLFTFVYVKACLYAISNVRYPHYEFNATVYPAYKDIVIYHEACSLFVKH